MRILFITSGSIGDAIISTGVLGHLLDAYPGGRFTIAAGPAAAPLFEAFPQLERIHVLRKQSWNRHWIAFYMAMRGLSWDYVVDLRGGISGYLLGAKKFLSFRNPDPSLSKAAQLAALFKLPSLPPSRLWASEAAQEAAEKLVTATAKLILLAPKTNSTAKDWPIERFAALVQRLRGDGRMFAVLASAAQKDSVRKLVDALPPEEMLDLSGKTDLLTAYALMERAALFIGNDSGLLHMAAAAKAPSVGIYGPSNDKTYAPRGSHVRIITAREFAPGEEELRDPKYMEMIGVEKVEAAVRELNSL